jgi:plasmid maintenance system antidote protein VapI
MCQDSSHGENLSRFLFQVIDEIKKTNNNNRMDTDELIGERLRLWALAEKLEPKDIYPAIGCSKGNWSEFISGKKHVTIDVADRLKAKFGLTLDFIYYGQVHASFPVEITVRMEKIKADEANGIFIGRRRRDRMRQSADKLDKDGRQAAKPRTARG